MVPPIARRPARAAGPRLALSLLSEVQRDRLEPALADVVEYRKSGLSLNWIVGCPLDCSYCVRHLFGNFEMKTPRALMPDGQAYTHLVSHKYFRAHTTPIQLLNRATDPMLPAVKPHLFTILGMLDTAGYTNHVLVITRWRVEAADCDILNSLRNVRVTLLVTHSGITDKRIEPVRSEVAAASLRTAFEHARRYRVVLYWRPIVPGFNDTDAHLTEAMRLRSHAHAVVFTGLFYRAQIRDYYRANGLPEPYADTARRKVFPQQLERRILAAAGLPGPTDTAPPLFRKTSCAVAYVHALPDYNGHVGVRELCDICPQAQLDRCTGLRAPLDPAVVADEVRAVGGELVEVTERAVVVSGLDEQRRYLLQHRWGHQVHDVAHPHHTGLHGRADLGWPDPGSRSPR